MNNAVAYSLQVFVVIAGAALATSLLRLKVSHARLWFWQGVLALCLLLPLVQPRQITRANVDSPAPSAPGTPVPFKAAAPEQAIPVGQILTGIYVAGVAVRFTWLVLGALRLRRYRRHAIEFHLDNRAVIEAQQRLAPRAHIDVSCDITTPVTFGLFKPVVLLPPAFDQLQASAQEAILVHEFIHIKRRDWIFTVSEEIVRSVMWFHPAIWWLLAQIQLSREQVVDQATIDFTQSREQYLEALLAIAQTKVRPDLALAPLFLRKRHLARRVGELMKDIHMSKRQLALSLATVSTLALVTARVAVLVFPMKSFAQEISVLNGGVTLDLHGARLLHGSAPGYSRAAIDRKVEGTVVLLLTLDKSGQVIDARVESGPEELRADALTAALRWHFADVSGGTGTRRASIVFRLPEGAYAGTRPQHALVLNETVTLRRIDDSRVPETLRPALRKSLSVREGDKLSDGLMARTQEEIKAVDEHLGVGLSVQPDQTADLLITLPGVVAPPPPPPFVDPPPTPGVKRIRVGGAVQAGRLIENPTPEYPALAAQARIQGLVRFNALIGADGFPKALSLVSGHPLLVQNATSAVQKWKYKPTLLSGEPVEVVTVVDVHFTLNQ